MRAVRVAPGKRIGPELVRGLRCRGAASPRKRIVPTGRFHHGLSAALLAAGLALSGAVRAEPYKCFDERGRITYSDAPCISAVPPRPDASEIGPITREQALAFMASFDNALARLDLERVLDHFADDAVVQIRIKSQRAGGSVTAGKAEFRRLLFAAKDGFWEYRLRRANVEVKVLPDASQAEVESELTEWWRDPGGAMTAKSREVYVVEMRRGRPKATALHVDTRDPEPQIRQQR